MIHHLTPAESRILSLIADIGKAERDLSKPYYVWTLQGQARKAMSRPVDSLLNKGFLQLSSDKSTATLSAKGRGIIEQLREAA